MWANSAGSRVSALGFLQRRWPREARASTNREKAETLNDWVEQMGLRWPIFQAPTGSIAGPELAAAVSEAGGMGAMALTWTGADAAVEQVRAVRARTDRLFQVNFALVLPPVALDAILEAGVPVVTFSWGDAAPYIDRVHRAGARAGVQAVSVEGARRAREAGADFLICQGIEAGGHVQSTTPIWDALAAVLHAADGLPVIAAGGITDGAGVAEAVRRGAAGAMLGTRFVATVESRAHPAYKDALVAAGSGADTALTVCFDGDWPYAPHRVLRNATFTKWEAAGSPPVGRRPGEGEVIATTASGESITRYSDAAPRVGVTGSVGDMCLYAGTGCGAISDLPTAAALTRRIGAEYDAARVVERGPR